MKINLPSTEEISVPSDSVVGRFQYITINIICAFSVPILFRARK